MLLKLCKESLTVPIRILGNRSIKAGRYLDRFKKAHVIPAHKPGTSKSDPASFHPVSLTSHISKVLERVMKQVFQDYLENNLLLSPNQHGFRAGRSCLSQLLHHQDLILKALEEGSNIDTVYLDLSKAFDKVDIGLLSHRLREMGISGNIGRWLMDFLTDRKFCVIANGEQSSWTKIVSG